MAETTSPDNSTEAMRARIDLLQEQLGSVLLKGQVLLDEFSAVAPHPKDVPEDFPVTVASPINSPYTKELSIRLSGSKLVIDRNPPDFPSFPLRRVILWTPQTDGTKKRTEIKDISHQRPELPFEIDVSRFNSVGNQHLDFIGYGYVDQEPHIEEVDRKLDVARTVITSALGDAA